MKTRIVRWSLAILTYPIQLLTMILYAVFALPYAYFFNFNRKKLKEPQFYWDLPISNDIDEITELVLNRDDHGLLTQFYRFKLTRYHIYKLSLFIDDNGNLLRTSKELKDYRENKNVSLDVLVAWLQCFYLVQAGHGQYEKKILLRKVANNYLKNLGSLSDTGWVSARNNNFGINYCPDGFLKLGQPCFGMQFYASSALFSVAKKELGGKWNAIYWLHWILFGGWVWWLCPIVFLPSNKLGYARDITMKALWIIKLSDGFATKRPINYIARTIAEYKNPLFMHINDEFFDESILPENISPWFSQFINCRSKKDIQASVSIVLKQLNDALGHKIARKI